MPATRRRCAQRCACAASTAWRPAHTPPSTTASISAAACSSVPADEIARGVRAQIERLAAIASEEGVRLTHVKPHGALYNVAADDRGIADAIAATVLRHSILRWCCSAYPARR